jgi:DNA replication initiation complex subunit (GINS family)
MTPEQTTLSQLRDHLQRERSITDLEDLDTKLIQQARDRLRKIENSIKAGEGDREQLAEEGEAILETLHDISRRREEKILMLAKYPEVVCPLNRLLPSEAKLYQDVRSAILVGRGAWKL